MKFKKPKFWDYSKISFLSVMLFPLTVIYLIIFLIIKTFRPSKKFASQIICVGNIYLGGTGKTPLSIEIFNILKSLKKNPAFIKKSYNYLQDEIEMLKKVGKTFVCKKRATGISVSITEGHDIAILDDGFQDFSVKPNFSVLCFNSKQLIGNGLTIPSGPLREPFKSISRAQCIIINGDKNLDFENKVKVSCKEDQKPHIFYSKYKINNLDQLINKEITAFAGIGNPSNFFDLLRENNLKIKKTYSFPDHHNYSKKDFDMIRGDRLTNIVTTEKDFNRMDKTQKQNCLYVDVSLEIDNKDKFIELIKKYL